MSDAQSHKSIQPRSAEPPTQENLTKEVVQFLSKEIETVTTNMMLFRTRVGFGLLIGPFLLLSSFLYGAKGQPVSLNLSRYGWGALMVNAICFIGIAYIASEIEAQAWDQCNKWRRLIGDLHRNPSLKIDNDKLEWSQKPKTGYLLGYCLAFISLIAAVIIIKNAGAPAPLSSSGAGATFRIEQVSPNQTGK